MAEKSDTPTLEMRVAALEDKLSGLNVTEDEMRAYHKVASLMGAQSVAAGAPAQAPLTPTACQVSACVVYHCTIRACTIVQQCTIRACTIVQQCTIRACTIEQCINECGGGLPGGGGFGGGFGTLGG